MKKNFMLLPLLAVVFLLAAKPALAQCQFGSSRITVNSVTPNLSGGCTINFNFGFDIDFNNGSKVIFIHLWRSQDYTQHTYSNQGQPKESDVLGDALATIIIDNDFLNSNPTATPAQVFKSVYAPDPGIDDNIAPAIQQVKDASDGLTYNRVIVNLGNDIYRYTINNISVVVPGSCSNTTTIKGDAWASNSNASNAPVHCAMQGFSFLANDPVIDGAITCQTLNGGNAYSYSVTTQGTQYLTFSTDVYLDNGDLFFDPGLDTLIAGNSGPYVTVLGQPFSSGPLPFPAPRNLSPDDLWIVLKNMTLTDSSTVVPVVTPVPNSAVMGIDNTCGNVILPVSLIDFSAARTDDKVLLQWKVVQSPDITGYQLQRKTTKGTWANAGMVPASGEKDVSVQYAYTDINTDELSSLYRLQFMNKSGKEEYSKTLLVPGYKGKYAFVISPNPATDGNLHVQLSSSGAATINLYDMQGHKVRSVYAAKSGTYTFSSLQPNMYLVKITGDGGSFVLQGKAVVLAQ
jgi:hypothetical protein